MASLRKSIDDMCKRCVYDPYDKGTWKQQVKACASSTCPLFPVRPGAGRKKRKLSTEQKAKLMENLHG